MIIHSFERLDGSWFWHLQGANSEIVVSSEVLENDPDDTIRSTMGPLLADPKTRYYRTHRSGDREMATAEGWVPA